MNFFEHFSDSSEFQLYFLNDFFKRNVFETVDVIINRFLLFDVMIRCQLTRQAMRGQAIFYSSPVYPAIFMERLIIAI